MRHCLSALALATIVAVGARAEAQLSPRVRMMMHGQLAPERLGATPGRGAPMTVRLPGGAARLRALGLPARALSPSVAAVELTPAALARLVAALPGQISVEEQRVFRPLLDRAGVAVGAVAARQATGLTGAGVLVGVVDTGIDWHHADLRATDGTSRVDWLLDLSAPPDGRHPDLDAFGGLTWDKDEIDAALAAESAGTTPAVAVTEADVDGHGTHVASIAVSNGLATGRGFPDGRYVGVAPDAELVVAQAGDDNGVFTDATVLDACSFVVDRANLLQQPLVLNLSLGSEGGPHDGSTNFEVALDELFPPDTPGRALVVAAGNDGSIDMHAGGWALDGELAVPLQIDGGSGTGDVEVDVFYAGAVEVAVQAPSGTRSPFVPVGGTGDALLGDEGQVAVDDASSGPRPSGLSDLGIDLQGGTGGRPAPGTWKIILRGRATRWDAWLGTGSLDGSAVFTDDLVTDDHITVPGTAQSAITVGASVSRLDWPTIDGRDFSVAAAEPSFVGDSAYFSSAGPTTDGRFEPDLVAPGEYVVAAMSQDATPGTPRSIFREDENDLDMLWADDGVHGVLRGTSQAAPFVAGAVALLFQSSPSLTSPQLRELLRTSAAAVPDTAGWSPEAGFGLLDVPAALALLSGQRGSAPSATESVVGVSRDLLPPASEETTFVTVTPRDAMGRTLGPGHAVDISMSAGAPQGGVIDEGFGRYQRTFVAHAPRGAIGVVTAVVDGVTLAAQPRVFFATSRADVGGGFLAIGGCALSGTRAGNPIGLALILIVVAVAIYIRRRW